MTHLVLVQRRLEWNEHVRSSHVAIVFRNFIFQDEVVAEGIPCQLTYQPMVLMCIAAPVGKDKVGINFRLQILEEILYLCAAIGEESVTIVLDDDFLSPVTRDQVGAPFCLVRSYSYTADDHPIKAKLGIE